MATMMTDKEVHDAFDEVIVGLEDGTANPAEPKVLLKSRDGQFVDVDSLNVSDNVKQLLKEVDAEGNGSVDDENVADMLHVVGMMKSFFGKGGKMSHSEIENGLGLLQRLVKEKDMNSGEMSYGHLPECIKEVMSEWDMDRSGSVNVLELSAAAKAHKKVKEEGRMMKRIIGGLFLVILILLIGMLVMSYLAVEMAKEMRGNADGVMQTNDGQVVKVASSAFDVNADGTMVSREGAGSTLQVAQSKPKRQLSSTIPDDILKKLDMVSLKQGDHFVQLKVNGMQRIQTKTSKCGSVVEFKTVEGVLTVDDYTISADEQLAGYLQQAGMANVLEDGVFGRRLSAGFLDGFFTQLEDMEWECTSVALPRPEDIPKSYRAKFQITELVSNQKDKDASKSAFSSSGSGDSLIAGVMKHGDQIYRSWSEDVLKLQSLRISGRNYAMHPLQTQLDLEMPDGGQAFIDQMGDTGHNCRLGSNLISSALESMIGKATGLRLVGLENEKGMVLRKWRMEVKETLMKDTMSQSILNQGFAPEMTLDYLDVDTDPTEKFESGYPYRIHLLSTDGNTNVTLQYLEMAPVTDMDLPAALSYKGITKLSAACEMDQGLPNPSAFVSLGQELDKLVVASSDQVPRIDPWVEWPTVVKYTSDKLKELVQLSATSPELQLARASNYWKNVLSNVNHQELLTNLANSNIENGDTYSERALANGVTLKAQVEYTTDSNSLPGGIKKLKVTAEGTRLWPETGVQVPVNGELEISVQRGSRPYAKSCSMTSSTMTTGALSGESFPVDVMMCLTEEFDYVNFKVVIQNGNLSPGAWHFFLEESNFAVVNPVARSRQLCPIPFWGTLFCGLSYR